MDQIELEIGQRIRSFRKAKGLTIQELSSKVFKSKATLSKYEKGELSVSITTIYRICEVLNIHPVQLLPTQKQSRSKTLPESSSNNFFRDNDKFYAYYYDGRNNTVIHSILEITGQVEENRTVVFLYMNISDYKNYISCENTYKGYIEHYDALSKIVLVNQSTDMETFMINVFASFQDVESKWGLMSGISFRPMMPIAAKMLISKRPLHEINKDELILSKDDISKMKLYNMLTVL